MKIKLAYTLTLSLILSASMHGVTAYASSSPATSIDIAEKSMEDVLEMNYTDSVGYYLEKEIPQGLEFIILGKNINMSEIGLPISAVPFANDESDYYNPSTPISKKSGDKILKGVWWGGIMDDTFISGAVAAATIAKTDNTQSKASVKPGLNANWVSSDWKDTGEKATVVKEAGISGNKAKWDLQAK